MGRLLLFAFLLLATALQSNAPSRTGAIAAAGPSCPGSDSFSGTGALSSCWTSPSSVWSTPNTVATLQRAGGLLVSSGGHFTTGAALYTGTTFPNDQYMEITLTAVPSGSFSLCVRSDTLGNGYCYLGPSGNIDRFTLGAATFMITCSATPTTVGHTYKFDAQGTTISLSDVTAGTTMCTGTNSMYSSGIPLMTITNGASGSGTSGIELSNFATGTP